MTNVTPSSFCKLVRRDKTDAAIQDVALLSALAVWLPWRIRIAFHRGKDASNLTDAKHFVHDFLGVATKKRTVAQLVKIQLPIA